MKEIGNELSYGAGLGVGVQLWILQITGQYNRNLASFAKDSLQGINLQQPDGVTVSAALMFGKNKNKKEKKNKNVSADEFAGEY